MKENTNLLLLVLIHGAGCDSTLWPFPLLHHPDFEVLNVDLGGRRSQQSAGFLSVEEHAQKIISLIGSKKAVICGHSLGGGIALHCALSFPEKVAGLILVGTGARLRITPMILKMARWRWFFGFMLRKITKASCSKRTPPSLKQKIQTMMGRINPEIFYNDLLACDQFDILENVGNIRVPTLILCGEEDRLTPVKYSLFLNRKIPHSQLIIFSETGHMLPIEQPEKMTDEIMKWFASNSPAIRP